MIYFTYLALSLRVGIKTFYKTSRILPMTRSEVLKSNARRMMDVTNIWWIEMVLTSLRLVGNLGGSI